MYYRGKILLALVEAFGGSLSDTDCNKIMFLFGQRTGRHYYDFFPYKYGACSFVLYQDKLRLADLGLLHQEERFRLNTPQSYLEEVDTFDKTALQTLETDVRHLRGQELLRKVYIEYPFFASRSQIASQILSRDEYEAVCSYRKNQPEPCLFTIGYEGITIDAYLNKLLLNHVHAVIDVRKNPVSMKYGFSKGQMQQYLENVEIDYYHIPDLGVESSLRKGLNSSEAYQNLFAYYQAHVLPSQAKALDTVRSILHAKKRVALTCFEALYTSCHRHKISECFAGDSSFTVPIAHL
jgi:uncharacterized protein (DUF488 family)